MQTDLLAMALPMLQLRIIHIISSEERIDHFHCVYKYRLLVTLCWRELNFDNVFIDRYKSQKAKYNP